MKNILFIAFAALFLTGCQVFKKQDSTAILKSKLSTQNKMPVTSLTTPSKQLQLNTPPTSDKIQSFQWKDCLAPLIHKILCLPEITRGDVLLVDNIQNQTNGNLQVYAATAELQKALKQSNTFNLVPITKITLAKQYLGLSAEDILGSRRKAIDLGHILNAQYVLYSTAAGEVHSPHIIMQLMLVKTGEIIWHGEGTVSH
ncbi:penicillin-binding protein activator LpoB [Candidatus Profftia tarda]|nr:penicillin-binding protein activator LpoB [Candidatus Profftia tarda]